MPHAVFPNRRHMPPLTAIRAFDAVVRCGTVSAASRELGVTPGAVSRQIRILEDYLSVALFDRVAGRLQLTAHGREYQFTVAQALDQIESTSQRLAVQARSTELSIACMPSFHLRWLLPRQQDFESRHTGIDLRVYTAYSTHHKFQDLGIDAAIGVGEWPLDGQLIQTSFMDDCSGPVLTPDLLQSASSEDGRLDFARVRKLKQRSRPDIWSEWHRVAGIEEVPGAEAEFDHMFMTIEAARAGLGVAIAPTAYVQDELEAGYLVAPYGFMKRAVPYHIAWRATTNKKQALAAFIDWLRKRGRESS